MLNPDDIARRIAAIRALIEERLRCKAPTLGAQIRKLGRALPRRARAQGRVLVEAEMFLQSPKLLPRIDAAQFAAAEAGLTAYLDTIDPRERRITQAVRLTSVIVVNLAILVVLLVVVLRWRGFL